MSAIVEFVLARIAEDEAATNTSMAAGGEVTDDDPEQWHWVKRSRTECGAKRVIVELSRPRHYTNADDCWYSCDAARLGVDTDNPDALSGGGEGCICGFDGTTPILKVLAAVYAGHPDYDETWRP